MCKNFWFSLVIAAFLAGMLFTVAPVRAETECTDTGYYRDNVNLTAAYINPEYLSGEVIDASGCHIGVYYDTDVVSAKLDGVEIYGASYFGVIVNGSNGPVDVNVFNSSIHHIGDNPFDENPFSGAQHGVGIYYAGLDEKAVTGMVQGNEVYAYQKGGIVVNGDSAEVTVKDNVVTGLGPVEFIAQNGIQFGWEARGKISGNTVSGNEYTVCSGNGLASCAWISAGILLNDPDPTVWKGASLKKVNDLFDNQVDLYIYYDR